MGRHADAHRMLLRLRVGHVQPPCSGKQLCGTALVVIKKKFDVKKKELRVEFLLCFTLSFCLELVFRKRRAQLGAGFHIARGDHLLRAVAEFAGDGDA